MKQIALIYGKLSASLICDKHEAGFYQIVYFDMIYILLKIEKMATGTQPMVSEYDDVKWNVPIWIVNFQAFWVFT